MPKRAYCSVLGAIGHLSPGGIIQRLGLEPIKRERLGIKTFGSQKVDEKMRDVVELELESVKEGE